MKGKMTGRIGKPATPWRTSAALMLVFEIAARLGAQSTAGGNLDPARSPAGLPRLMHVPLAEQYIWTADDVAALRSDHATYSFREFDRKTEPHAFRGSFELRRMPLAATLSGI